MNPRGGGYSLWELLISLLIVAIVAVMAVGSYRSQVARVMRTDAKLALLLRAQQLERCYTLTYTYDDPACPVLDVRSLMSAQASGRYQLSELRLPSYFRLTASAVQVQRAQDQGCTALVLDSLGQRTATAEVGTDTSASCW